MLEGAHMLCRERGPEVNLLLHHHVFHGRRLKDTQHKYLIGDPDQPTDLLSKRSASQTPETSPSHSNSSAESDTRAVERRAWPSRDHA